MQKSLSQLEAMEGCLIGTAVGDALGLPFEGLSARRIRKFKPVPLRHRFFFGRGMISDDTEHTCMVAQCLIESAGDFSRFKKRLARRLRWWFLGLPAGIGFATLRAIVKLWLGINPERSGVWSAGNGPAMRSGIIGVYAGDDFKLLTSLVNTSTLITHSDPKAYKGACIVAKAAQLNASGIRVQPGQCVELFEEIIGDDDELRLLIRKAENSANNNESAQVFAETLSLGGGVSGYIYHTLPVVLQTWLRYPYDYEKAIEEVVSCGGDTDTVAAIVGAIVGAGVGIQGIPQHWQNSLMEWPRSRAWISRLAKVLAESRVDPNNIKPPKVNVLAVLFRNLFFMCWVLLHGFRRLLPPY